MMKRNDESVGKETVSIDNSFREGCSASGCMVLVLEMESLFDLCPVLWSFKQS